MKIMLNGKKPRAGKVFRQKLISITMPLFLSLLGSISVLATNSTAYAQAKKISLNMENVNLIQVFDAIRDQSDFSFWYSNDDINANEKITVKVKDETVSKILDKVLQNKELKYEVSDRHIIITKNTSLSVAQNPQQGLTIKGKVVDNNGDPILGGSIQVKGKSVGQITDMNGNYSIQVDGPTSILIFSYIGYQPIERTVGNTRTINITLQEDVKLLDEVLVTGYQTISRERSAGAFSILTRADLDKSINLGGVGALEGRAAGVSTYGNNVVIRGISTFSSSIGTDPLLVIDGLPTNRSLGSVNTDDIETMTILKDAATTSIYGVRAANGVIVITTKKGKEGKVQINFSSTLAMTQNPSLSDYRYASTSEILDYAEQLYQAGVRHSRNGTESSYFENMSVIGSGTNTISYYSPYVELHRQLMLGKIDQSQFNSTVASWRGNDYRKEYMDEVYRNPLTQNYNLSMSKAGAGINTYFSVNYNHSDQKIRMNSSDALKTMLKSSIDIAKWFKANVSMDVQYGSSKSHADGGGFTGLEAYSRLFNDDGSRAYRDWVDKSDGFSVTGGGTMNPMALEQIAALGTTDVFKSYQYNALEDMEKNFSTSDYLRIRSMVSLDFKLLDGLSFNPSFVYEANQSSSESMTDGTSYAGRFLYNRFIAYNTGTKKYESVIPTLGNRFSRSESKNNNYTVRAQLNYNKDFKKIHNLVALAGTEWRQERSPLGTSKILFGYDPQTLSYTIIDEKTMNSPTGAGFPSYIYTKNFSMPLTESLSDVTNRYISFYGNAGYTYKGRYAVNLSFRIDQTNLFGTDPKHRYRPLWSAGGTWNATNEDFLKDSPWLDLLKVRASYGISGMIDKSSSPYLLGSMYVRGNRIEPTQTTIIDRAPNPKLRWERTTSYNFGVDYSVFKRLLNGSIDFYYKYSDDLLAGRTLDYSSGFQTEIVNNGAMSNTGFEFTLKSPWLNKKDWQLNSTLIFSWNKNKVRKVGMQPRTAGDLISGASYFMTGLPRDAMYAYRYGGLTSGINDTQSGIPYVVRADGTSNVILKDDGTTQFNSITLPTDVYYIGNSTPTYNISFNQGIKFKDFELNALFLFYGGHKIRKPALNIDISGEAAGLPKEVVQGWSPENPNSGQPKLYPNYTTAQLTNLNLVNNYWVLSDTHVTGGEFLRLRNLTFSYSLPKKYSHTIGMQNCKISVQANNPWFWSAAGDNIDPQVLDKNTTGRVLPQSTSYVLRLDIGF